MPEHITDLAYLPLSPKRLAKAANTSGWNWQGSFASGKDETGHAVDSILISCVKHNVRIVARWESVNNGKLALAVAWHYLPGQWPRRVGLNEAVALVLAEPGDRVPQ